MEQLNSAESTAKEVIKEAKEASKHAAMAGTNANAVKLGLAQLFVRNSTLKKWRGEWSTGHVFFYSLLIGHEVLYILLVLCLIWPPSAFVVFAGDWPGDLVLLLSLDLPIQGAFFPIGFMSTLNPLTAMLHSGVQL